MTSTSAKKPPKPWTIHFFQRDESDDSERTVPAIDFLDGVPAKVAAEIHAVLDAVAAVSDHGNSRLAITRIRVG